MDKLEDFKITTYKVSLEAQCPKCQRFIHRVVYIPLHVPSAAKALAGIKTKMYNCYCGHKGFIG